MEKQIIIVTPDIQFRDALKLACPGHGCQVEAATSIATGLELATDVSVCVVIADVSVDKEGDGVALVLAIHEQNPNAAYFLIVNGEPSEVVRVVENKAWIRLVHKPVQMLQLSADVVDAVAKCCGGKLPGKNPFAKP